MVAHHHQIAVDRAAPGREIQLAAEAFLAHCIVAPTLSALPPESAEHLREAARLASVISSAAMCSICASRRQPRIRDRGATARWRDTRTALRKENVMAFALRRKNAQGRETDRAGTCANERGGQLRNPTTISARFAERSFLRLAY
jgi:hypothetical protein